MIAPSNDRIVEGQRHHVGGREGDGSAARFAAARRACAVEHRFAKIDAAHGQARVGAREVKRRSPVPQHMSRIVPSAAAASSRTARRRQRRPRRPSRGGWSHRTGVRSMRTSRERRRLCPSSKSTGSVRRLGRSTPSCGAPRAAGRPGSWPGPPPQAADCTARRRAGRWRRPAATTVARSVAEHVGDHPGGVGDVRHLVALAAVRYRCEVRTVGLQHDRIEADLGHRVAQRSAVLNVTTPPIPSIARTRRRTRAPRRACR